MTKSEIINQLEKLGYKYHTKYYADKTIMTHSFVCLDTSDPESAWIISIEDHHGLKKILMVIRLIFLEL